jgi:hypothetical protein
MRNQSLSELLPGEFLDLLRPHALARASASLKLTAELLEVVEVLEREGIRAVPFKGAVLSQIAYGDPGARPFTDNDILVDRSVLERALECLGRLGYEQKPEGSAKRERYILDTGYKVTLARSPYGPFLDLHWEVALPELGIAPSLREMGQRTGEVVLRGTVVHTLAREDLFLALVIHGARHHWQRLLWIFDLAALARGGELDWNTLHQNSDRFGISTMLNTSLHLCNVCFNTGLPIRGALGSRSLRHVESALKLLDRDLGPWASERSKARLFLNGIDRPLVRLKRSFWLVVRPTPRDFEFWNLPDVLFPLYYPLRWIRVLVDTTARAFRSTAALHPRNAERG